MSSCVLLPVFFNATGIPYSGASSKNVMMFFVIFVTESSISFWCKSRAIKSSQYEADSLENVGRLCQRAVFIVGQAVVQSVNTIGGKRRVAVPCGAWRVVKRFDQFHGFGDVASASTEAAGNVERLAGLQGQQGFLGNSGHGPPVAIYLASEHNPRRVRWSRLVRQSEGVALMAA